ncbi:MAG: TonB-dependent receptor [Xanthomonadales bacterium]|nr:TonB-dependent receptor [Xanthomonadales bacterium]
MTLKTNKLRDAISFALVGTSALAASGVAFAQEENKDAGQLDTVVVTGSRIPRAELENEQPIITVSREQIEKQGFSSVADILQNLTSAGSPAISRANALSSGEDVGGYYIDLRNLGASRTLILLNGKRLGVSTSGLQDLGQIPMSAIERIDVLKDGASSIYGSDAIAGVVNVITRKNFEGAQADVYLGAYDQGESKQDYSFTIGANSDRGGLTFSAEYSKEDPVLGGDREFSRYGNSGRNFPFSGWSLISQNGVWLGGNCSSGLCTLNRGSDPRDPNNYHNITPAERSNANEVMYVQTGLERKSTFLSASYDITQNIRFVTDIGYNKRITQQQIAGYPGNYGFGLLSANSYFNPAPGADQYWFRRFWELPRRTRSELQTVRVSLGLEGSFDLNDHLWTWDVGFLSNENTNNKYARGDAYVPALQAALGPSYLNSATGRVECGSSTSPTPYGTNFGNGECIPFNPFLPYGQAGQGSLGNSALQAFLFPEYHDAGKTQTTDYTANIAGSLFSMPAGDFGIAFGLEHRSEEGRFVPDAVNQAGQSTGLPATTTQGSYSLDEAYLELEIPVLADLPGAKELTFNVASRYSDYSNFGNTTNNKFQMRWRPMDGLLVRATYADGFRAPAIADLYGGVGGSFEYYTDPCGIGAPGTVNGNAACNAAGVPVGYVQLGQANVPCTVYPCQTNFQFLSGSNPNLSPETAKSKTAGIVWSPKFADGLDLSLDWYDVKIDDTIISDSVDNILNDCYRNGIAARCAGIVRNSAGAITNLFYGLTNAGGLRTEGYDLGVHYRLPEFSLGKFTLDWQTSYTSKYDQLADNSADTKWVGYVGYPGIFRVRSNFGVDWTKGDFSIAYMARYYSGMKETCASAPRPCSDPTHIDTYGNLDKQNRTGSNTFHDLQFSARLPWNATASIGANNVTNHLGPIMFSAPNSSFPYYGGFDIGRFWYVKYQQRF